MISKNQLKLIHSLDQKKQRKKLGLFLVQGEKNVSELLHSQFEIVNLFATSDYISKHSALLNTQNLSGITVESTEEELQKAGTLKSNNSVLAVVKCKQYLPPTIAPKELILVLDQVGDPGNLGTIIRVADWYGINKIVCSADCADLYNPKVIAATMGSFSRVEVSHAPLVEYLTAQDSPIYGAFLEGENLHQCQLAQSAFIVMGSESHGISKAVTQCITDKITIPSFGLAESLNVAMATGIILDNFKR